MAEIHYRGMKPGEEPTVSTLILAAFDEYIAHEYSPEGVTEFRRYVAVKALRERVEKGNLVWVAATGDGVAGMIEIREHNHVALLFVNKAYQRQGIARGLLDQGLAAARAHEPSLERVTVNSTRYGIPAYERLGFRQTGPERTVNNITFIPMAMKLSSTGSV